MSAQRERVRHGREDLQTYQYGKFAIVVAQAKRSANGGLSRSKPWIGNKGMLGAYGMKRVAAGDHLPIPWLFEPAKRSDDRAEYCLGTRR